VAARIIKTLALNKPYNYTNSLQSLHFIFHFGMVNYQNGKVRIHIVCHTASSYYFSLLYTEQKNHLPDILLGAQNCYQGKDEKPRLY
jgi:hypothetical protein